MSFISFAGIKFSVLLTSLIAFHFSLKVFLRGEQLTLFNTIRAYMAFLVSSLLQQDALQKPQYEKMDFYNGLRICSITWCERFSGVPSMAV